MNDQELEKQINTSLIIMGIKLKALKAALNDHQMEIYNDVIREQKELVKSRFKDHVSPKELNEIIENLDV